MHIKAGNDTPGYRQYVLTLDKAPGSNAAEPVFVRSLRETYPGQRFRIERGKNQLRVELDASYDTLQCYRILKAVGVYLQSLHLCDGTYTGPLGQAVNNVA